MTAKYTSLDIAIIEDRTQPLEKRQTALDNLHKMFAYSLLPITFCSVIQRYDAMLQQEQSAPR